MAYDKEKLTKQFKVEVHDRAKKIDPHNEYDWTGLTLGWAIAKGLSPLDATEFATYIRYDTDLG